MIYTAVSKGNFVNAFDGTNWENNFSREARYAIYDYLEELSESTGGDIELDVCAIACEYDEKDFNDIAQEYKDCFDLDDEELENIDIETVIEKLEYHTSYIGRVGDSLVYASF